MSKKLLHLCLSSSEGGLEMYSVRLANFFKNEGYETYFACRPDTFIHKRVLNSRLEHITVTGGGYFSKKAVKALNKFVQDKQIDIIFLQHLKDLWITHWIKKKNPHIKIIGFTQMFVDYSKKDFWHKRVYKQLDTLVTLTQIQKEALLDTLPVPEEKYQVIPNGVDTSVFKPIPENDPNRLKIRKDLGIRSPKELLVGLIGRFDKQKGQLEFVEAIKELRLSQPNIKYVLVGADTFGEEPVQKTILEEILEHDLHSHVQVRGFSDKISDIMNALDIFIMPSYKETFGIVLIEAMACEKICISTRAGGPIEILNEGECGLLIEPKSAKAIEEGIIEVHRNLSSYRLKAQNARKRVLKRYEMKDVLKKIKELAT